MEKKSSLGSFNLGPALGYDYYIEKCKKHVYKRSITHARLCCRFCVTFTSTTFRSAPYVFFGVVIMSCGG